MKCKTCKYFVKKINEDKNDAELFTEWDWCHRYPPIFEACTNPPNWEDTFLHASFPLVKNSFWCGEYIHAAWKTANKNYECK